MIREPVVTRKQEGTDNKTMNPGTWNPRSYCRYGPVLLPSSPVLGPPATRHRRWDRGP